MQTVLILQPLNRKTTIHMHVLSEAVLVAFGGFDGRKCGLLMIRESVSQSQGPHGCPGAWFQDDVYGNLVCRIRW